MCKYLKKRTSVSFNDNVIKQSRLVYHGPMASNIFFLSDIDYDDNLIQTSWYREVIKG